ncbi:hypothetical protein M8J77_022798 [Diaphorina citri]|nr:hypothetical protein M8J77_022798 [Diaphorina citri]
MDASAKQIRSKPSLNEHLYRGPVLLENLCSLLLRFRLHKIGFVADIEKAFLNIGLNIEDRDYTRILWVKDPNRAPDKNNLVVLRHCRIPFGVISSPFLLAGVIRAHLDKYEEDDQVGKLKTDLYVDNLVSGVNSEQELSSFFIKSRKIFGEASLNLRSWASNCKNEFFDNIPQELKSQLSVQSVLGMDWDTKEDTLNVRFTFDESLGKVTKRTLLSIYGSFYDVMGLWAPSTVKLKFLLQSAWSESKEWDKPVEGVNDLEIIVDDLKAIPSYKIPRLVNISAPGTRYELHAFSDACATTYAATVYLRCILGNDVTVNLIFSKIKVAPHKQNLTLPRLELLGVLTAFRSLKFVNFSLNLNFDKYYLWCDNQCVLHWLHTTKVLPVFIKNRIKEIKASPFPIEFKYVRSEDNPSDVCCRQGQSGKDLRVNYLWWNGPRWLKQPHDQWPPSNFIPDIDESSYELELISSPQTKVSSVLKVDSTVRKPIDINVEKFSSFRKLCNVTCYVRKFIDVKCRRLESQGGPVTSEQYQAAKVAWLRYIQNNYFLDSIRALKRGQRDDLCLNLGLCLDENDLLVCKGRFIELQVNGQNLFPILLPRESHITKIIINDAHGKCFHMGTSQTLAHLRKEYWIPHGRSTVKSVLHRCPTCRKGNCYGPYETPEFSFYPDYRLNKNLPFSVSGVDYFGPLYTKDNDSIIPVWCLLFTCLTTRAVHLEVVESETSSDLFLAFRRFIARRGGCSTLLSDNAQQFKLLKKAVETIYSLNEFQDLLNDNKIEFKFTSPLSPWAGGTFERLISITKQCLRKSIGRILVSRKQLETLMVEIEYVVNSRPLGYYANEDLIITPNHFLCLKKDSLLPAGLPSNVTLPGSVTFKNLIALWKKGNKYLNIFWSAWYSQYLMSLRERNNVHFRQGKVLSVEPKVGDVVLIKQPKQTRSTWPYGVITKVHLGRDNRIRNVDVRISNGQIITRPVSLLYPFEFHY